MGPSTWSSGPPPPWVMTGHPPPGATPFPSSPSPWGLPPGHPSMSGPIPMGYQLAKDPMTGQILLIPTDHTGQLPPSTPGFGYGFDSMSGMPTRMPPTSS